MISRIRKNVTIAAAALVIASLYVTISKAQSNVDVRTLSYHLATNAAGHAKGYSGTYDDMLELSHWGYAVYSDTNLFHLTNAVWSTNFWLHGVKGLSATAIGFSNGMGGQGLITMVSPRHYLFSSHMHPEGYLTAFLDTNNVICWRRTLERVEVTDDIAVGILNADLPASVGYIPVAPANILNYLPTGDSDVVQGIGMNQDMRIFGQPMFFRNGPYIGWNNLNVASYGLGTNWNVKIRSGDSSGPERLLIGDQLVLVTHTLAINAGPNYAGHIPAINEKMHYLSTHNHLRSDYQLTEFSLKKWPAVH